MFFFYNLVIRRLLILSKKNKNKTINVCLQTRALISVFEQDADELLEFAKDINAACRRVSQAQVKAFFVLPYFSPIVSG